MKILYVLLVLAVAGPLQAANKCNALLAHGITERVRERSTDYQSSNIKKEVCDAYQSYKSSTTSGGGSGQAYFDMFGGSVSYSKADLETIGKLYCENDRSDAQSKIVVDNARATLSDTALDAWRACNEQDNLGLFSDTDFNEDNSIVTISINFVLPKGSKTYPTFQGVTVSPEKAFTCNGVLASLKKGASLESDVANMTCSRNTHVSPTSAEGRDIILPRAAISVHTSAGAITRYVGAVYKTPPPAQRGKNTAAYFEVKYSALNQATCSTFNTVVTGRLECGAAIQRFCQNTGFIGGFPQQANNDVIGFVCVR